MSGAPKCIDISHWQGFPNFEEVARQGVIAMIHKATEGTTYVDPNLADNVIAATKAGLSCATYFWLKPGDARAQAEHYLATIEPVPGERVVIDYEEDGCTLTGLRDAVQALLDYRHNLQITVYSGHLLKQQLGDTRDAFLAANTSLWVAHYCEPGELSWPSGTWPQWTLWQYTDQGELHGIDGSTVDFNRFNGSDDALLAWINPAGSVAPTPEPQPDSVVTITISAPSDVKVIVKSNVGGET